MDDDSLHLACSASDLARIVEETFVRSVEHHRVLGSTNDRALQRTAEPTLEVPLLILAEEQTAGRGRGSNAWWAGAGALTFSLVLEPAQAGLTREQWPQVSLTAGLAVCRTLEGLLPATACGLKWPNDVHLAGKKVCGILVEVPPVPAERAARLVIGIGLNVNNSLAGAPADVQARATSLRDVAGQVFSLPEVLRRLLVELDRQLRALAARELQLAREWESRCVLRDKVVEVQQGSRTVRGRCLGIAPDGALRVETSEGIEQLYGGLLTAIE